jgi:hypothetical protein
MNLAKEAAWSQKPSEKTEKAQGKGRGREGGARGADRECQCTPSVKREEMSMNTRDIRDS